MDYKEWVTENIYRLTAVLAVDSILFRKNYNSITELYKNFSSGKTSDTQKAVDYISGNLGIASPKVEYDWGGELDHNLNIKGQMSKGKLTISLTFTLEKEALAATVVHELMHYVLIHKKNIILSNSHENEKITDLVAIVLGFGKIMLNGKVLSYENNQINTLGYLSFDELRFAYQRVNKLREMADSFSLTHSAKRILDGTIKYRNLNNDFWQGFTVPKPPKKYKTSLLIIGKKYIKFFIRICKYLIKPVKKKICPFCHKRILLNLEHCNFCKRILVEKL